MTHEDIRQININCMDRVVDELAAGKSFSDALKEVYVKRHVHIPMSEDVLNTNIEDIGITNRTVNAIRRAHIRTVGDLIGRLEYGGKISDIRTLGLASQREFKEMLLNYAWNHMSQEEKDAFLIDTVANNVNNVRI